MKTFEKRNIGKKAYARKKILPRLFYCRTRHRTGASYLVGATLYLGIFCASKHFIIIRIKYELIDTKYLSNSFLDFFWRSPSFIYFSHSSPHSEFYSLHFPFTLSAVPCSVILYYFVNIHIDFQF